MNKKMEKENRWPNYGMRIFLNTLSHPFEYAKVLIQIGHEPIPPQQSITFFGKPTMKLPNIFQYVKHIYTVDGFTGCYRGLTPKLCGSLVSALAIQKMVEYLELENKIRRRSATGNASASDDDDGDDDETSENAKKRFIKHLKGDIITHSISIICSNSFNVITVRMMAEFVGHEGKYTGLFTSIREIYRENGFMGFCSGLVPRLLGDICSVILASSLTYVINRYLLQDKDVKQYTSAAMSLLASSLFYPLQVVSNCMAVTNSGLAAGAPPFMPIYANWWECWGDLSERNELKRGASLFVRYYTPPTIFERIGEQSVSKSTFAVLPSNYMH